MSVLSPAMNCFSPAMIRRRMLSSRARGSRGVPGCPGCVGAEGWVAGCAGASAGVSTAPASISATVYDGFAMIDALLPFISPRCSLHETRQDGLRWIRLAVSHGTVDHLALDALVPCRLTAHAREVPVEVDQETVLALARHGEQLGTRELLQVKGPGNDRHLRRRGREGKGRHRDAGTPAGKLRRY